MAYNLTVSTFKAVGKDADKMTLGDLSATDDWQSGVDQLKTLKDNGGTDKSYTYCVPADAQKWGYPAGWYLTEDYNNDQIEDLTPYCKNATPVAAGEAFVVWVGMPTTTITIPSAL